MDVRNLGLEKQCCVTQKRRRRSCVEGKRGDTGRGAKVMGKVGMKILFAQRVEQSGSAGCHGGEQFKTKLLN